MKISRSLIIKAIKAEVLERGDYFQLRDEEPYNATCPVCAVGAVIRHALPYKALRDKSMSFMHMLGQSATENSNYLGALSDYFESSQRPSNKELAQFVKDHFPKEIDVDLDT